MLLDIIAIVIGVFVVLKGADFLTDGAVSLAQRADAVIVNDGVEDVDKQIDKVLTLFGIEY